MIKKYLVTSNYMDVYTKIFAHSKIKPREILLIDAS